MLRNTQTMVNVASGGALNNKTLEEAYELIEVMKTYKFMKPIDRSLPRRVAGIHDIDSLTT